MGLRTSKEYIEQQRQNKEMLIREGVSGVTKMDTMPNSAFPLENEAEAMYFKAARDFLETMAAHIIFNAGEDESGGIWI